MDDLGHHKSGSSASPPPSRRQALLPSAPAPRPQSDQAGFSQAEGFLVQSRERIGSLSIGRHRQAQPQEPDSPAELENRGKARRNHSPSRGSLGMSTRRLNMPSAEDFCAGSRHCLSTARHCLSTDRTIWRIAAIGSSRRCRVRPRSEGPRHFAFCSSE